METSPLIEDLKVIALDNMVKALLDSVNEANLYLPTARSIEEIRDLMSTILTNTRIDFQNTLNVLPIAAKDLKETNLQLQ
jgi:hypothetical protein